MNRGNARQESDRSTIALHVQHRESCRLPNDSQALIYVIGKNPQTPFAKLLDTATCLHILFIFRLLENFRQRRRFL